MNVLQLSDLSIPDLKKTIKKYQSLDFKNSSIADADKLFRLIIKHFVTQTMVIQEPVIYRARKNLGENLFKNISELIYPKNPLSYGRLNEIGESLFYGASDHNTALLEMRPKLGDEITILESRLINNQKFPKLMEVGVRELMIAQNHSPDFIKNNHASIEKELQTEDNKIRYGIINNFLISEMTKIISELETYNYKGTITIGQFFIKKNPFADGMIYPSISRNGATCIVFKPDSYHQFYKPDRCFKCKITKIEPNGTLSVLCTDNSTEIDFDGNITWT